MSFSSYDYRNQAEAMLVIGALQPAYNPAAQAFFDRIPAQTNARKKLYNDLFVALSDAGILAKLECLWLPAAADATAARANLISSSFTLTPVNSPTFTVDRGYAFDASTNYLDTGWTPSASSIFLQDSASLGHWLNAGDDTANNSTISMGSLISGGNASFITPRGTGDVVRGRMNQASTVNYSSVTDTTRYGFTAISRTGSTATKAYKNNSAGSVNTNASATRPTFSMFIGGGSNSGSLLFAVNNRFSAAFVGSGLSDAEMLALYNALNTYLTAVGGN